MQKPFRVFLFSVSFPHEMNSASTAIDIQKDDTLFEYSTFPMNSFESAKGLPRGALSKFDYLTEFSRTSRLSTINLCICDVVKKRY